MFQRNHILQETGGNLAGSPLKRKSLYYDLGVYHNDTLMSVTACVLCLWFVHLLTSASWSACSASRPVPNTLWASTLPPSSE